MTAADPAARALEQTFGRIERQRMRGVPVLNPKLRVECVGLRRWRQHPLGVLITPWFMNLVLLPGDGDDWPGLKVGEKVTRVFPSGAYEFILGDEVGVGRYLSCSLFSPVFQFDSQQTAVATAEAVLAGLMDERNREDLSMHETTVERLRQGDGGPDSGAEPASARSGSAATTAQRVSRRDLLRGRLFGAAEGAARTD